MYDVLFIDTTRLAFNVIYHGSENIILALFTRILYKLVSAPVTALSHEHLETHKP